MTRQVLVAEDNALVNDSITCGLEAAGYECVQAYDGAEALRLFDEKAPEAMVLDLNLPRVHGLEVLRQVKASRPTAVVIVLTGHGTEQAAIRALKLGADVYLQKPVRASLLAEALQKNLDRVERERRADLTGAPWSVVPDETLAQVLFGAPSALILIDDRGRIAAANQLAGRLLGRSSEDLLGCGFEEFLDSSQRANWMEAIRREVKGGGSHEWEVFLWGAPSDPVPVHVTAVGRPAEGQLVLCLRDLSRQKALELHYFETKKLASLGRVVEGVAHEVRNPVVSMGGFARKLWESFADGSKERKYLEVVLEDVRRLEHMVEEIEAYVAFTNRHRPAFAPVDLNLVLGEALANVAARFESHRVVLEHSPAETLPRVFGDEALLGELFEGLAENAYEAMPTGGSLSAVWDVEGNWVRLRLTDSGTGILEDEIGEIFNPFVTSKTSGAGLGLAKAYMIVEEHSGTIEFESTRGSGTICSVSLPVDRRRLQRAAP